MKDLSNQKGRWPYNRFPQRRALYRYRANSLNSTCLLLLPAFLVLACRKELPVSPIPQLEKIDSTLVTVILKGEDVAGRRLDIFVYEADGAKGLQQHIRPRAASDSLRIATTSGEKIIVAIAGSPFGFNLASLGKFDSMLEIEYAFVDDSPESPVSGGYCQTVEGRAEITLKPLMSRIMLSSISNCIDGYELLEHPRIRLKDQSARAKLFQANGFYPSESIDSSVWKDLPCDVGIFTQHPQTVLYCYPDQTPSSTLGVPHTTLELECGIMGETCRFDLQMPPIGRNSLTEVEITVENGQKYSYTTK